MGDAMRNKMPISRCICSRCKKDKQVEWYWMSVEKRIVLCRKCVLALWVHAFQQDKITITWIINELKPHSS